jgi:hypothetical protein
MNDIFKRGMKQFAKGVAYRLVADAVKDGAKKLHERYNSTKSKNEKDNGGSELKKEDISHHDGDGPICEMSSLHIQHYFNEEY